jgi:hypothetical protein
LGLLLVKTAAMFLVLWPSAQRPEMNGQPLQFADNVDFVLPELFIVVVEQAMFMFTFSPD